MITLTRDKHALVKAHRSIRALVHEVPRRSTPRKESRLGTSHPPERRTTTTLPHAVQWNRTTPVRRLCAHTHQPQFTGHCGRQASPSTSTPHVWDGLATKQSKAWWWQYQKSSQAPTALMPRSQEVSWSDYSELHSRSF
jgi:hypothetical protein